MKASKKNARRLKKRIADWEDMKLGSTDSMYGENTKIIKGMAYHKPGSQKK